MRYNCETCNYFSDDCANFRRHQKSTKHLKKVNACQKPKTTNKNDYYTNGRPQLAPNDQLGNPNNLNQNYNSEFVNHYEEDVLLDQEENSDSFLKATLTNRYEETDGDDGKKAIRKTIHKCQYCHKKYMHASSLSYHKKYCNFRGKEKKSDHFEIKNECIDYNDSKYKVIKKDWEKEVLRKELEIARLATQLALKDKDIEVLETKLVYESKEKEKALQDTKEAKDFIKSGRLGDTYHLSVKNFVLQHYPDAPALQCLKDYDDSLEDYKMIHNEECHLLDVLVYHNEKGRLHKYLGDFLKANYKKSDPTKQSIWNSDASRLTYIIKELFDNQDSDWYYDKSGIKTKEKIVKPLLDHLKKMVINHIRNLKVELDELDELDEQEELGDIEKADYGHKYDEMDKMVQLQTKIDGDLADQIIKYIAPMFYLETGNFTPENESVKVLIGSSNQQVKKEIVSESQTKDIAVTNQTVRQKTRRRVLSLEEMRANEKDS